MAKVRRAEKTRRQVIAVVLYILYQPGGRLRAEAIGQHIEP